MDLQMVLDAFVTLCRTRGQGVNGPANLSMADIAAVWSLSGWEARGMEMQEFLDWMLTLDAEFLAFLREKNA